MNDYPEELDPMRYQTSPYPKFFTKDGALWVRQAEDQERPLNTKVFFQGHDLICPENESLHRLAQVEDQDFNGSLFFLDGDDGKVLDLGPFKDWLDNSAASIAIRLGATAAQLTEWGVTDEGTPLTDADVAQWLMELQYYVLDDDPTGESPEWESSDLWILYLNDMRYNQIGTGSPAARASSREVLEFLVAEETVTPYIDKGWKKSFRRGGPLEWFNPPTSEESFKDFSSLYDADEGV